MTQSTDELERLHAIWQTGSDDAAANASNDIMEALPELLAERDRLSAERDALKALCHEASEHYGYGGTFPIRGLMARRLIGAALGDWEPVRAALKGAPDER